MGIDKDLDKERANFIKHGVDFSFAASVFQSPPAVTLYDRYDGEHRWHTLAHIGGKVLLVGHAYPDPDRDDWVRVIGLREATPLRRGSTMRKGISIEGPVLTNAQQDQLSALEGRRPDTVDIPEAPEQNWTGARRFFKPRKEPISLRIDADLLDRLRRRSGQYQTEINRILRERMDAEPPV